MPNGGIAEVVDPSFAVGGIVQPFAAIAAYVWPKAKTMVGSTSYKESLDWSKAFEPQEKFSYPPHRDKPVAHDWEWIEAFCKSEYELLLSIYKGLDDRADGILRYLGSSASVVTLGTVLLIKPETAYALLAAAPSAWCAIVSAYWAARARVPDDIPLPFQPRFAFERQIAEGPLARAVVATNYEPLCQGLKNAIAERGRLVRNCVKWYWTSIACLMLPLLVVAFSNLPWAAALESLIGSFRRY